MADGRSLPVTHPELIAYKTGTRTAIVVYDDSFEFIDLLLATGLKFRRARERRSPLLPRTTRAASDAPDGRILTPAKIAGDDHDHHRR